MRDHTIALFGEAEKGNFQTGYLCNSLAELESRFGNPPEGSRGLFFAVQTLLFHYKLIFFRVEDEGYSLQDYLIGFQALKDSEHLEQVMAIGLPGVGDAQVLKAAAPLVEVHHQLILTTERDLYDLYTSNRS